MLVAKRREPRSKLYDNARYTHLCTILLFLTFFEQAVPEGFHSNRLKGLAIATDIDDGTGPTLDLPPPSKAGAIEVAKDASGKPIETVQTGMPGAFEMGPDTTGWAPRFGWPQDPDDGEDMLDHTTFLESRLSDKFFGGECGPLLISAADSVSNWVERGRLVP
jgi:hypothetical protein